LFELRFRGWGLPTTVLIIHFLYYLSNPRLSPHSFCTHRAMLYSHSL
jgi:hypothetical protein